MKIAVVGTGYVGLVTGTCLAEAGNDVFCVDVDEAKVRQMQAGGVPIYEPGLSELFERNIREDRLHFTTDLQIGIAGAAVIFLALPTPPGEDGSADLSYIIAVAEKLGGILEQPYTVIVNKSTVPVGTAEKVRAVIAERTTREFDVVSNPEFLREGFAVADFMQPDRIVVGSSSERAVEIMGELYQGFSAPEDIYFMDERSSEMTKYAANSFLATKISFMNEIANLCEQLGANVDLVRRGIGSDHRIGSAFLAAGIGYGGSCFPKDVMALQHMASESGSPAEILAAASAVNKRQEYKLIEKIKHHYGDELTGKRFAVWGLAFKPDTDDIREAPSLKMIQALIGEGVQVSAFDPEALENTRGQYGDLQGLSLVESAYDALKDADALLIATEWPEFRNADLDKVKELLKQPIIFDGRNIFDLNHMREHGFHYESIGRPAVN